MGKFESADIIFGILYTSAAIFLLVASYMIFIKRYKRSKLLAVNEVTLNTSRYDVYTSKTQFLIELSKSLHIVFRLLDENEEELETLLDKDLSEGEHVVDFDPLNLKNGIYFLSLKTEGTSILRKITIEKQ